MSNLWIGIEDESGEGLSMKRKASPADLLAAVRRGVESGTIEGGEFECERCDGEGTDGFDRNGSHAAGEYREFTCSQCDGSGRVLVIPVDGEDTCGHWEDEPSS